MNPIGNRQQLLGCITGGAIGDAMGGPYEGQPAPITVEVNPAAWRLSDDTQMSLATCEAMVNSGDANPEAVARCFREWFASRRITGIGASTLKALRDLQAGAHWALCGARGERAAGNGAAMRIAPLAFVCDPDVEADRETIRHICRITHHNDEAYAGALAILLAVRLGLSGRWQGGSGLLSLIAKGLPDTQVRDAILELSGLGQIPIHEAADRCGCSGFVAASVPLALLGAEHCERLGFEGMLRALIAVGGDTDTIASMAGQVAGAMLGEARLPSDLLANLPDRALISETCDQFARRLLD